MKALKAKDLILRCYAQEDKDQSWYAICIDLNIISQGGTLKEARSKLHEMIKIYLSEAFNEDNAYFDDLIPRKAPLYFQARYYWLSLVNKLSKAAHHARSRLFNEHLPLTLQTNHG